MSVKQGCNVRMFDFFMIYEEITSILISKEWISNSNKFGNNLKFNNIRTKQENVIIFNNYYNNQNNNKKGKVIMEWNVDLGN